MSITDSQASTVGAKIADQASSLESGAKVTLIAIDATEQGAGMFYMHYALNPHTEAEINAAGSDESKLMPKPIYFAGIRFDYWPFNITGVSHGSSKAANPTLSVANLDSAATAINLAYNDLKGAKVNIITVYAKHLDAVNFAGGNPTADPTAFAREVYWVNYKSSEDDTQCDYSLNSPADVNGIQIPTRVITNMCEWAMRGQYRSGNGCTYSGTACFDKNDNPVPDQSQDVCAGLLNSCQIRFGAGLSNPKSAVLDFGGFPAARLLQGK